MTSNQPQFSGPNDIRDFQEQDAEDTLQSAKRQLNDVLDGKFGRPIDARPAAPKASGGAGKAVRRGAGFRNSRAGGPGQQLSTRPR